ncbi:MAG TPA: hypothetical protein VLE89_06670, partial [Chlamydiales bacterium]|nr:hypothetical protein [Chlamydiales bacterium]
LDYFDCQNWRQQRGAMPPSRALFLSIYLAFFCSPFCMKKLFRLLAIPVREKCVAVLLQAMQAYTSNINLNLKMIQGK